MRALVLSVILTGLMPISAYAKVSQPSLAVYPNRLFNGSYELLNSSWGLFMENFVAKKVKGGMQFYAEESFVCSRHPQGSSTHFRDQVLEYREVIKEGKAKFIFRSCNSEDRSFQINISSNQINKDTPRAQIWKLLKNLNLKKGEASRQIRLGQVYFPDDFELKISRSGEVQDTRLIVTGTQMFRARFKADSFFQASVDPQCAEYREVYGKARSCFGGDSEHIEAKYINGSLRYIISEKQVSRNAFETRLSQNFQARFQYTIDAFVKRFMKTMPRVELNQTGTVQTEFEKDFRQAFQRILNGDFSFATILLRKNIDKLDKSKVLIQEVD